jgi:hypothetical protein
MGHWANECKLAAPSAGSWTCDMCQLHLCKASELRHAFRGLYIRPTVCVHQLIEAYVRPGGQRREMRSATSSWDCRHSQLFAWRLGAPEQITSANSQTFEGCSMP